MYILYGVVYLFTHFFFVELFKNDWNKKEGLPDMKRSNNVLIGKSSNGLVYHDFTKFTHMIVAGHTGYGKTNFLKNIISQLDGDIILIDLKGGFDYGKVTSDNISDTRIELEKIVRDMRKNREDHIYIIIDEAGELLPPEHLTRKESREYYECLTYISEIARLGRSFNVHLIYATQYPTADILNRQVKQNCETKVCFRLPTQIASRVVLDEEGAEDLKSGDVGLCIYKKDIKHKVRTYKFKERNGWNEKVRDKTTERTGDYFIIE